MRRKHGERECSEEPWVEWEWLRFPGTIKVPEDVEKEAERQTDGDFIKSIPQLVCDFHVEAEKALRRGQVLDDTKYVLNAQKRMVAMMAQVARTNDEVSNNILRLTKQMTWFTIAIFFLAIVSLLFSFYSYFCPARTLP
jgi:hypothetical protein